jgi:flagellar hook-associated protein 1 FlgK
MSGTFSSFGTALSALRYNRIAMDVASGNIANAGTEGYARRQVVAQATGAPAVQAIWSRWPQGSVGDGVQSGGINRMVDPLLDSRARTEHAALSYADTRAASLVRFETSLAEPGENGVAAALDAFKAAWHSVGNNPGDDAARSQLLARAESLVAAISNQDRALTTEWADQRVRIDALTTEVNQVAGQLADLNDSLRSAHVAGTDAGVLLDQRDQLTMRLAELTGSKVTINDDTTVDVFIEGEPLVTPAGAVTVTVAGPSQLAGTATGSVSLQVGGTAVALSAGEIGGAMQVVNQDLPSYRAGLDAFVNQLVTQTNTQHAAGIDPQGDAGVAIFSGTSAATLAVSINDPADVAAAAPGEGELGNGNATALANLDLGGPEYRKLITDFGVQVSSVKQGATNQGILTNQVDASRQALSGISIDEEMVHLLAAQRGYEGAARVLTTIDSVLNTLINRMAV